MSSESECGIACRFCLIALLVIAAGALFALGLLSGNWLYITWGGSGLLVLVCLVAAVLFCSRPREPEESRPAVESHDFVEGLVDIDGILVSNMTESIGDGSEGTCIICRQPIKVGEEIIACLHCACIAHRQHMLDWLQENGTCPMCRR